MRLFGTDAQGTPLEIAPAPAVNAGFEERGTATFQKPPGGPWTLRIDDEPLAAGEGSWSWTPGFFAGEVTAQLVGPDGSTHEYLLDVAPDRKKLGREHFAQLVAEVAADDPALLAGGEPATILTNSEHLSGDPLLALVAFARMRAHVGPFLLAIAEVSRRPRTMLHRARAWVPLQRARRLDGQSVRTAIRQPDIASMISRSGTPPMMGSAALQLDVPVSNVTRDTAANRCLSALLMAVRQRARATSELLIRQTETRASETRTSLAVRLPARLELLGRMAAAVASVLRQRPWQEVSRAEITAAGLNAVASDPAYARAFQLGWKALRSGIGELRGEDRLWMSPTWELFERWCFVRVARQLRMAFPSLQWKRLPVPQARGRALAEWCGTDNGSSVRLLLQPVFPSGDQRACDGFQSISRMRVPDMVLTYETSNDCRFIVLDAKYRRGREAVLEEMAVAHTYRDSLRWRGQRPQGAYLLLPAMCDAAWLSEEVFRRAERVGVMTLEDDLDPLVQELLSTSS